MSESSSSSGTRPTAACQTRAFSSFPAGIAISTSTCCAPASSTEQLQRQALRVEHRVGLQLPAVQRQRLPEVPRPVQQPDPDERQAEVRGRLEVVAREHAEAARVVGQHLGDAELHREVADRRGQRRVVLPLALVPARLREVLGEVVGELADRHDGLGVGGQLGELGRGDLPSSRTGSWPARSQASGSSVANRSSVGGCQLHRRLVASVCSGASAGGSCARTVKRRRALTEEKGR